MIYIDDKFTRHPKVMKAGRLLGGGDGPARALAVYLAGLAYAVEYLTDGFVPDPVIASCGLVQTPQAVASVLCSRGVRLWHRVPGGYLIHDYHEWNKKSSDVREKRAKWRAKKAAQRRKGNGQYHDVSPEDIRRDVRRDSRAPVPRSTKKDLSSTNKPRSGDPGDLYRLCINRRVRVGVNVHEDKNTRKHHAETRDVSGALCDGARGDRARDRRRSVDGRDQVPTCPATVRVSTTAPSRGGHARGRTRRDERRAA